MYGSMIQIGLLRVIRKVGKVKDKKKKKKDARTGKRNDRADLFTPKFTMRVACCRMQFSHSFVLAENFRIFYQTLGILVVEDFPNLI